MASEPDNPAPSIQETPSLLSANSGGGESLATAPPEPPMSPLTDVSTADNSAGPDIATQPISSLFDATLENMPFPDEPMDEDDLGPAQPSGAEDAAKLSRNLWENEVELRRQFNIELETQTSRLREQLAREYEQAIRDNTASLQAQVAAANERAIDAERKADEAEGDKLTEVSKLAQKAADLVTHNRTLKQRLEDAHKRERETLKGRKDAEEQARATVTEVETVRALYHEQGVTITEQQRTIATVKAENERLRREAKTSRKWSDEMDEVDEGVISDSSLTEPENMERRAREKVRESITVKHAAAKKDHSFEQHPQSSTAKKDERSSANSHSGDKRKRTNASPSNATEAGRRSTPYSWAPMDDQFNEMDVQSEIDAWHMFESFSRFDSASAENNIKLVIRRYENSGDLRWKSPGIRYIVQHGPGVLARQHFPTRPEEPYAEKRPRTHSPTEFYPRGPRGGYGPSRSYRPKMADFNLDERRRNGTPPYFGPSSRNHHDHNRSYRDRNTHQPTPGPATSAQSHQSTSASANSNAQPTTTTTGPTAKPTTRVDPSIEPESRIGMPEFWVEHWAHNGERLPPGIARDENCQPDLFHVEDSNFVYHIGPNRLQYPDGKEAKQEFRSRQKKFITLAMGLGSTAGLLEASWEELNIPPSLFAGHSSPPLPTNDPLTRESVARHLRRAYNGRDAIAKFEGWARRRRNELNNRDLDDPSDWAAQGELSAFNSRMLADVRARIASRTQSSTSSEPIPGSMMGGLNAQPASSTTPSGPSTSSNSTTTTTLPGSNTNTSPSSSSTTIPTTHSTSAHDYDEVMY